MKGAMKTLLALTAIAAVGVAAVAVASASPQQKRTVVIGWAYDGVGNMAAYDGPALATAKERVAQLNRVRSNPARYRLITCNTQGNKPAIAKACAAKLVSQGADIVMTTCDVDYAAPVVQYAIDRGKLTVAACIGTDQMGPKRFGPKGRLAFSYGNVAQDEGSAMAEFAWKRGWRNASLATDTVIVYFRNVVQAFKARWRQLGGRIATEETYQSAGGSPASWQNTVTRLNAEDADVIVTATAPPFGAQVPIITGLRTLGNNTPILNSWAGDGNYWYATLDPKLSNYYYVTFASAFGDDPVRAVNALRNKYAGGDREGRQHGSVRDRLVGDRRDQPRAQADGWQRQRRRAGRPDVEVQERPDPVGARDVLADRAHGVGPPVPGHSRDEQHPAGRRHDQGQGRPEDLRVGGVSA